MLTDNPSILSQHNLNLTPLFLLAFRDIRVGEAHLRHTYVGYRTNGGYIGGGRVWKSAESGS